MANIADRSLDEIYALDKEWPYSWMNEAAVRSEAADLR